MASNDDRCGGGVNEAPDGWGAIVAIADEHGDTVSLHTERWSHAPYAADRVRREAMVRRLWSTLLATHFEASSLAVALSEYRAAWASPDLERRLVDAARHRAELERASRVEAVAAAYGLDAPGAP
jgi:hypothetical protein